MQTNDDQAVFRRPESVLVVIYTADLQVLLMRRCDHADYWQSITGGLEHAELPAQAALRELAEETGIRLATNTTVSATLAESQQADPLNTLIDHQRSIEFEIKGPWRARYHADDTHNKEHVFSVCLEQVVEVSMQASEHSAFQWVDVRAAVLLATSPTNRQAIVDIVCVKTCP